MLFHQEPAQCVQHNTDMQPFDNNFHDKIANTTKICLLPNCHAGTTKLCPLLHREQKCGRYNWHGAGSLGWPFPMLKYKYIFQIKYTEAILSNSSRKLLRFEISRMLIAV